MPGLLAACCLLALAPLLAAPEGIVLWYPLDGQDAEILPDAVGNCDAALRGIDWPRNSHRAALRLSGRTSRVTAESISVPAIRGAFSVDLWYNSRRSPDPVGLVTVASTFRVLLYPTGKRILVDVFGTDGKRTYHGFSCPVKVGSWQHLALTYGPGQGVIVYLDGQPVYTNPADLGGPVPMAGPLRLGLDSDPMLPRHFSGLLGGFRIWNKVLTQKEIAQIMQDERPALTGVFRGSNDLSPKLPPAAAIPVGSSKQLLFDDRFIEASKGTALRMNPPQKVGPVLIPENPWEDKSLGFCASVLEHEGIFKLFYETWSTKGTFVCLATSENGVTWERPRLGIIEFDGSTDNNIVFEAGGEAVVFLDPHGKPEERFKMICVQDWPSKETGGVYCHTSPDGLHWTAGPKVFDLVPDTANQAAWDNQRGRYVAYVRKWDPLRKVGRIEMDDIMQPWPYTPLGEQAFFIWGKESIAVPSREMPTAFGYDEQDPAVSDHYNPAIVEYPWAQNAYFSFPSAYMHFPEPPDWKFYNDGLLDIQLAVSRDGVEFHRPERGPYVELGLTGEPDSLSNYMAVGMARVGDYLYQYYGGYDVTHGLPESEQEMPIGSFCAVRQRLDGFVSVDAPWEGGEFMTPPITFTGERLVLNLNASAMGVCLVGILDENGEPIEGFGADYCDPLRGNSLAQTVTWGGKSDLSALAGKPVRLHFMMRAAKLFAFQFEA